MCIYIYIFLYIQQASFYSQQDNLAGGACLPVRAHWTVALDKRVNGLRIILLQFLHVKPIGYLPMKLIHIAEELRRKKNHNGLRFAYCLDEGGSFQCRAPWCHFAFCIWLFLAWWVFVPFQYGSALLIDRPAPSWRWFSQILAIDFQIISDPKVSKYFQGTSVWWSLWPLCSSWAEMVSSR